MRMSWNSSLVIMSLKSRRFSLDSSVALDGAGLFGGKRMSSKKRHSQSLDEARREIQELNQSLLFRENAITEEELEHTLKRRSNSFQKHKKSFHKLFPEVPEGEKLTHVFTCALQKEVLYHGKLYVSQDYVCFHSSVLLKDTKVVLPALSVRQVKKHSSALSMLSIQTADGEKYSFVSLRNREMCHQLLQSICSQCSEKESPSTSPHLSSAENEADPDRVSSYSSLDDSVDHGLSRQHSVDYGDDFPQIPSAGSTRCDSFCQSSPEDKDRAVWWLWSLMEKVTRLVCLREMRNVSTFVYIYILLIMVLLLASGYIGLKIIALEEQLNTLGALTELVMHNRERRSLRFGIDPYGKPHGVFRSSV